MQRLFLLQGVANMHSYYRCRVSKHQSILVKEEGVTKSSFNRVDMRLHQLQNIEPNDASCNLDNCFILSTWKCIYQMHVMQYFCPLHQSVLHDKIHFIFWSKQFHHQSMCVCDKVTQLKLQVRSTFPTNPVSPSFASSSHS